MTLRGADISHWQSGIKVNDLPVDFVICKATEGVGYTDRCCDGFVQACIDSSKLWGFYHFARSNSPEKEADYFVTECRNYFGHGVPVLDYEVDNIDNVRWCERFMSRVHEQTGVWPLLYISASRCKQYKGSWIPDQCGLWVAGYPDNRTVWGSENIPYDIAPWSFAAIWQFTDKLGIGGFYIDGDYAYMTKEAWDRYANPTGQDTAQTQEDKASKACEALADEVIAGKWGNGADRRERLIQAYDAATYEHVQRIVNDRLR